MKTKTTNQSVPSSPFLPMVDGGQQQGETTDDLFRRRVIFICCGWLHSQPSVRVPAKIFTNKVS
jgi:hypothetical protein